MIYHVSCTHGITTLTPKLSTHKRAYVYAIDNLITGLLFGAKHDDFDFLISTDENGRPFIYECYPQAFQKIYQGISCSIYELKEEGFMRGMTSWDPELVSETEVYVQKEIVVSDLYQKLLDEESNGNLVINRYRNNLAYKKMISQHIVDRIIRFDILEGNWEKDSRFELYYKGIIKALVSTMDGHLL